mmetsp:Transcript_53228/g.114350  ORF Transcript_53228/g.114350 Transcript_53228/m.114350 type:complete len:116 (-) Transcript_53228:362-709(-)
MDDAPPGEAAETGAAGAAALPASVAVALACGDGAKELREESIEAANEGEGTKESMESSTVAARLGDGTKEPPEELEAPDFAEAKPAAHEDCTAPAPAVGGRPAATVFTAASPATC